MQNGCHPRGATPIQAVCSAQRRRSTSTKSTRAPPRPARAEIDGAERGGGAAAAADHLAEVVGVHPDLEDRAAAQLLVAHARRRPGCRRYPGRGARELRRACAQASALAGVLGGLGLGGRSLGGVSSAGAAASAGVSSARRLGRGSSALSASLGLGLVGLGARPSSSRRPSWSVASALGSLAASLRASLKISSLSRFGSA